MADRNNPDFFAQFLDMERRVRVLERVAGGNGGGDGESTILDTVAFNGILSPSDDNVQKAMDKLDDALNGAVQVFSGSLGGELTGIKTLITRTISAGMSNNGARITVSQAGKYFVHAQQLVTTTTSAIYFHIRKNGNTQNYGYVGGSQSTVDAIADTVLDCVAGDYIDIFIQNTAATVWTGAHCDISIFKISQGMKGDKGMNWRGAWANGVAYSIDDVVAINGSAYICIAGNTSQQPPNATYWAVLASKGDQGIQGEQGIQGLKGDSGIGLTPVINEALAGVRNGVNKVFTLAQNPAGVVQVFLNGQLQTLDDDYTILGQTVTFSIAPKSTEPVNASYFINSILGLAGTIENLTILQIMEKNNPIGTIRSFGVPTNPASLLGFGTWAAHGSGRVEVCFNSLDTEFNEVGKLFGSKTHQLTTTEMPSHWHSVTSRMNVNDGGNNGSAFGINQGAAGGSSYYSITATTVTNANPEATAVGVGALPKGGNGAHNNIQPSIVSYRWIRTA